MLFSSVIGLISFCILILFTLFSQNCIPETREAVTMFLQTVLPTMFPFYVLSSIILSSCYLERFCPPLNKFISRIMNLPLCSISAILLGYLCGFPIGAKIICDLKKQNKISERDAIKLSSFTNNVGPIFMTTVIGGAYLGSTKSGFLIWISVIIASFISGILICNPKLNFRYFDNTLTSDIHENKINLSDAILSGLNTVLYVGAVIIFFSSITSLLKLLPGLTSLSYSFVYSTLEITGGLKALSTSFYCDNIIFKYMLIALFSSWSGFCVHIQVCGILTAGKVKIRYYFLGKIIQTLLAPLITFLIFGIFY